MDPMPFASSPSLGSLRGSRLRLSAAIVATLVLGAAPALAETGGPLPQGYTTDVPAPPQSPPPAAAAPQAPLQQVQQGPAPDVDPAEQYADTDPSALTDFREPLAPYGQWTQDPTYGTLWVPDAAQVGADFAPYQSAGQWGVADSGDWMWQSDYSWGYIPFHYGRWVWAGTSWGWIPGRRYAPAWVTWRVGEGGYLGWAPLPPTYYWGGGRAVGLWTTPHAAYCFVPTDHAFNRGVASYVVRDRGMVQSIAATTRPYHPATPTVGGGHGANGGSYNHHPASPTLSEAHIPASASPRGHAASADPRSVAFATRSSTAAVRSSYAPHAAQSRPAASNQGQWRSSYSYTNPSRAQSPGQRTPAPAQGSSAGHATSAPTFHPAAPSFHSAAPSYHPSNGGGAFHPSAAPAAQPSSSHTYSPPAASHGSRPSGGRSGGGRHR